MQTPSFEDLKHRSEEFLNALTHALGVLASLVGGIILIRLVAQFGDLWEIVSVAIYSASLLLLYSASTLYHAVRHHVAKAQLRVFDHCAIYVLIAGTYTPFALGPMRGALGLSSLAMVWMLALAGIGYRCFASSHCSSASLRSYLAMSWFCVLPFAPALPLLAGPALLCLLVGGLAYTAGTLFYTSERIPYAHPIWHGFVLVGSAFHFASVLIQLT